MALATLKKRAEFLRLRGGSRWATPAFVLETKSRPDGQTGSQSGSQAGPRFGFTVTKTLGGAVVRNRIRRRLKAAVGEIACEHAKSNHDYVLIARAIAYDRPFAELKKDLEQAFQRVHHPSARGRSERQK